MTGEAEPAGGVPEGPGGPEAKGQRNGGDPEDGDPIRIPVTGELDLHCFRPDEIGSLIPEYLRECRRLGLRTVRIVHGKGRGVLREGVHRLLDRLPEVLRYRPGDEGSGGWGATWVEVAPWTAEDEAEESP